MTKILTTGPRLPVIQCDAEWALTMTVNVGLRCLSRVYLIPKVPTASNGTSLYFFDMIDVLLVEKFNRALERSASLWVISKYAIRQRYAVLNQIRGLISAYLITLTNWVH